VRFLEAHCAFDHSHRDEFNGLAVLLRVFGHEYERLIGVQSACTETIPAAAATLGRCMTAVSR
jgi:hypothetical protein